MRARSYCRALWLWCVLTLWGTLGHFPLAGREGLVLLNPSTNGGHFICQFKKPHPSLMNFRTLATYSSDFKGSLFSLKTYTTTEWDFHTVGSVRSNTFSSNCIKKGTVIKADHSCSQFHCSLQDTPSPWNAAMQLPTFLSPCIKGLCKSKCFIFSLLGLHTSVWN